MSASHADGGAPDWAGLARAAHDGDEAAFAELYELLEPVARRSAHRAARTHPQLDVDEAVNIGLTRLWKALDRFDDEQEFLPWAAVVIAHAVRSAARTCRSAKATMNWGAMLATADAGGDPTRTPIEAVPDVGTADGTVLEEAEDVLVSSLLHELLSDREARALRMRMAGWTHREIAEELGVNLKSVDNALRRAGDRMRRAFRSEEELVQTLHEVPG